MAQRPLPIPIHDAAGAPGGGCRGCPAPSATAPDCHATTGAPCANPRLTGRRELLRQAMASLRRVVDGADGGNLVDRQLVRALRIEDGEVELTLTFAPRCGSARELAEGAFETLRRLLPDTDVYVRFAA